MIRPARFAFPTTICLLPIVALLAPHAVVPLGVAAAVAISADPAARARFGVLLRGPLAIALVCLFAWGAASCLWAPHPGDSLILIVQVVGVMLAGFMLIAGAEAADDEVRRRSIIALGVAGAIFPLLIGTELLDKGMTAHIVRGWREHFTFNPVLYDRGAAVGSIVAWPIAFTLWRRFGPRTAFFFLALMLAFLFQLEMAAASLAFVVAGAIFLVSYWKPRESLRTIAALTLLAILVAPPVLVATGAGREVQGLVQELPDQATSVKHRLLIGQFVLGKIAERPFTGFGFDSSRSIPGGQAAAIWGQAVLPLHPHNGILQIWLELGLPGAIFAAAIVTLVLRRLMRFGPPGPTAMATATFAAFMTIAVISFGIWQNWWLMLAWMAAVLTVLAARAGKPGP